MKAGTETGSLINHLMSRSVLGEPAPVVGMPATVLHWTDRQAATVAELIQCGKSLIVATRDDIAKRVDKNGMSESQDYEFSPNPNGSVHYFRKDRAGKWVSVYRNESGRWINGRSAGLLLGSRQQYHDFSF